jgi:hypothetical protein
MDVIDGINQRQKEQDAAMRRKWANYVNRGHPSSLLYRIRKF